MRTSVVILSAAFLIACGGSGGGSTTSPGVFTTLDLATSSGNAYQYGPGTTLTLTALDQNGHTLTTGGAAPTWTISDTSKVSMNGTTVVVKPGASGPVTISASLTLNGITKSSPSVNENVDIAPSTGAFVAMTSSVYSTNSFDPTTIDLKSGGTVNWSGLTDGTGHNVHFSSITPFASGTSAMSGAIGSAATASVAITAAPGSYAFHCDHHPEMVGTIVVH